MEALAELVESLPAGVVATDPATMESYRFDWSRDTGAGTPSAVERVEDAAFGPLDRIGQLALRVLDLEDTRDKLALYGRLGLTSGDATLGELAPPADD